MFQSYLLADKSIPLVGSSNKTNLDPPHSAIATESFRLFPPDN